MRTTIIVQLQVEWFHCWKDCPILEVDFLKDRHRHIFHIRCEKEVSHADRDIEIILFKRKIQTYLHNTYFFAWALEFESRSCEMIAQELVEQFDLDMCEVLEDWENGGRVYK